MDAALWGQVVVASVAVIGSVIGYVLAGFNDARRDRRAAIRERATRLEDRDIEVRSERHAFQRATLLELQDSVQLMARLTGRAMTFDLMQARKGEYTQLVPGWSDEMHENAVDVTRLRNRLLNEGLRQSIEQFQSECVNATTLPDRYQSRPVDEAEAVGFALMRTFGEQVNVVMAAVGEALRANLSSPPISNVRSSG
jgi:hypothetical protein